MTDMGVYLSKNSNRLVKVSTGVKTSTVFYLLFFQSKERTLQVYTGTKQVVAEPVLICGFSMLDYREMT